MTERNPTVVVTSDETLPDIVQRLRGAARGGRTVHLVVPIDSSLLLTASEFRTLKDAIDDDRLSVVMRTADPLRLRLGERLGVPIQALPRPRVSAPAGPSPTPPAITSPNALRTEGVDAVPFIDLPSESTLDPGAHWPGQNGKEDDAVPAEEADGSVPAGSVKPALENPPRRWLPVAALLAIIVLATFFLIRYVVPHAVVRVVPKKAPVEATLVFDVTESGQPMDELAAFALSPATQQLDVVWEGNATSTGVRVEPDGTAAGPIELRNAASESLTVDAGTLVSTETGVEFAFVEPVTVPAMDQATGDPGAATGAIRAVNAGTTGNVDTGEVGGRLPNGIYYSNRMEPASGGTDQEFPVVAQADLDALSAAAGDGADELAAAALSQGEQAVKPVMIGLSVSSQSDAFDHQVGEDAGTVSLRSTLTIQASTIDMDAAMSGLDGILTNLLAEEAPPGFAVRSVDIVYETPREVEASGAGSRFELVARAEAVAELDDTELDVLAAKLAGANEEEVAKILAQLPEIAEFTVENQPGWLSDEMPGNPTRIQIELVE